MSYEKQLLISFNTADGFMLRSKLIERFESGISFPAYAEVTYSVSLLIDDMLARMASIPGFRMLRIDGVTAYFESSELLANVRISNRSSYRTISVSLWAETQSALNAVRAQLDAHFVPHKPKERSFGVDWLVKARHGNSRILLEESVPEVLLDSAYPSLRGGYREFIDEYLSSPQSVLVLHGPPGTGKTKLLRAIMSEIALCNKPRDRVLFTGDRRVLDDDEIFMEFISGQHCALVIEDADHILQARQDGNDLIHRFLTISDGIVQSRDKKIVFSSNLPNLGDIDEALLRPGRCFGCIEIPRLTPTQAATVLRDIESSVNGDSGCANLTLPQQKSYSLAEVYQYWTSSQPKPLPLQTRPHVMALSNAPIVTLDDQVDELQNVGLEEWEECHE